MVLVTENKVNEDDTVKIGNNDKVRLINFEDKKDSCKK